MDDTEYVSRAAVSRRGFLQSAGAFGVLAGLNRLAPAYAQTPYAGMPLVGTPPGPALGAHAGARTGAHAAAVDLRIAETAITVGGRRATATAINDTVPGPLLRFREGEEALIRVTNALREDTSIHWHGLILPNPMDGVPGVTFDGIRPGTTFTYRFPLKQYGTYWYHSHSGLQEQTGHYGPIIIDPAEPEPFAYDREYVVMLSDWTFENPYKVLDKLKKKADYYNYQRRTVGDFFGEIGRRGLRATIQDRLMWGKMRMSPVDISDVTGATYTYLMNGRAPDTNWTALFRPGERVRLRFINAGAGTYFDVRIPDLPMTVIAVSGQWVQPMETDEFRLEIAQTVDVIVEPREDRAFTIFAESVDRSGYARGTLAPRAGMTAVVPWRRPRPVLTMADMGMAMDMPGMAMGDMEMSGGDFPRATPVGPGGRADAGHANMPGMTMPGAAPMPNMPNMPNMPGHTMPGAARPDTARADTAHANMPGMRMPGTQTQRGDTTAVRPPAMPGHQMPGMTAPPADSTGARAASATGAAGAAGAAGMAGHNMAGMSGMSGMAGMAAMPARTGGQRLQDGSVVYTTGLRAPGTLAETVEHGPGKHGVANSATPMATRSRLGEPGPGLGKDGWRVLVYTDLRALKPRPNALQPPTREIELHLTGNMERFMWSINGIKFSDVTEPIRLTQGERVRITMVNDTMMSHPMHLHGMWMELENGTGPDLPRVHTVDVKPADRISVLVTPEDPGPWAFHCHVLNHMEMGMFRVVEVSGPSGSPRAAQ